MTDEKNDTVDVSTIIGKIDKINNQITNLIDERDKLRSTIESLLKTIHEQQVEIAGLRDLLNES